MPGSGSYSSRRSATVELAADHLIHREAVPLPLEGKALMRGLKGARLRVSGVSCYRGPHPPLCVGNACLRSGESEALPS